MLQVQRLQGYKATMFSYTTLTIIDVITMLSSMPVTIISLFNNRNWDTSSTLGKYVLQHQ